MRTIPLAALMLSMSAAQAYVIDFGQSAPNPTLCSASTDGSGPVTACGNSSFISQSYGDVAGVSDITYTAPRFTAPQSLYWWDSNYNNLFGVAWAGGSDSNSMARIEIKAVQPDTVVTLNSFDLGAYPNTTRGTTVNVLPLGGGAPLFTFSGNVGQLPANLATTFTPAVSAVGGLWIEWMDSAYNVGIDNISYGVSAVPEPATGLLLALGLAGCTLAARRRAGR